MTAAVPLLLVSLAASPHAQPTEPSPAPRDVTLLALPSGEAVPLLEVLRRPEKDGTAGPLEVVYWAGSDLHALASTAARERELLRAQRVFEAFRVWCVTNAVHGVVVGAATGRAGHRARLLTVRWTRTGPQTWGKGDPAVLEGTLPPFSTERSGGRHAAIEAATKAAATRFLSKLDARKLEEAWGGASPQLKRATPLADFERAMQLAAKLSGPVSSRKLAAWMYPVTTPAAPAEGATVVIRFIVTNDGGEGVEDVTLRMESDQAWRVAMYQPSALVPDERRSLVGSPGQNVAP